MSDDFYTMVDSGDPAPDNEHITGVREERAEGEQTTTQAPKAMYAARIAVYDDMLSTPRVIVIDPQDVRTYLEETTNTVYQCMKEQGGHISLMVIREIVENFIHAHFAEPIISILDGGDTIRFADQGPGIDDKERAFDFGVTSANSKMKRYIRGTGAGFPMVQEYLENAGGAVSIEDNMGNGTVVTVSLNPKRVQEIERAGGRGAAVRPETEQPRSADGGHAKRPANGLPTVPARVSSPIYAAAGIRPAVSSTVSSGVPAAVSSTVSSGVPAAVSADAAGAI
ncbi:MAG: ATP-binding protein [Collinsella sp.]|nr:ATP-binding protein [Collinsella sp.]